VQFGQCPGCHVEVPESFRRCPQDPDDCGADDRGVGHRREATGLLVPALQQGANPVDEAQQGLSAVTVVVGVGAPRSKVGDFGERQTGPAPQVPRAEEWFDRRAGYVAALCG